MIHHIPPNLYCVTACLYALTGEPLDVVLVPVLNRHAGHDSLSGNPGSMSMIAAQYTLLELGYRVFRHKSAGTKRQQLRTWTHKYKGEEHPFLVAVPGHALVMYKGKIYDTKAPGGIPVDIHPDSRRRVDYLAKIVKREV